MKRIQLLTLSFISAAVLLATAGCDSGGGEDGDAGNTPTFAGEGDPYPAVSLSQCDGTPVDLDAWIGEHDAVFITFGAKWCVACQEEAPIINSELVDGLSAESVGVAQILIEADPGVAPSETLCAAWRDELGARFTVLVDTDQNSLADHFGEGIGQLPLHFIVTRDKTIRLRKLGSLPTNIQQLVRDWLP